MEFIYQPVEADLNKARHIDNARTYDWLSVQRLEFFKSIGVVSDHQRPYLVRAELDFKRELFFESPIQITTKLTKLGNTSMTLQQSIHQDDQFCVNCLSISVCFDNIKKERVHISGELRAALSKYLD